jgi:hypothetical protein
MICGSWLNSSGYRYCSRNQRDTQIDFLGVGIAEGEQFATDADSCWARWSLIAGSMVAPVKTIS